MLSWGTSLRVMSQERKCKTVALLYTWCVCYLCLCVLWLVSDRGSSSDESASWDPNLVTSPGFLAGRDTRILHAHVNTKSYVQLHDRTHPIQVQTPTRCFELTCVNMFEQKCSCSVPKSRKASIANEISSALQCVQRAKKISLKQHNELD